MTDGTTGDHETAVPAEDIGAARLPGLAGARALVTGGSRGIGRATVRMLARSGAAVGVSYHTAHDEAEAAVREARLLQEEGLGDGPSALPDDPERRAWHHAGDLGREGDVEDLFAELDERWDGLDVFVGNAGIWNQEPRPLASLEPEEWDEMHRVNLRSIYLTTREAVRRMGEGGRVVLLSSTAGQRGEPDHSHYASTKGAIVSFAKSLSGELGPRGITVNAVAPGWVDTDMSASVLRGPGRQEALAEIPLGRIARAEDVAGPVLFLASDLARHVTGEVVNVNGGSVLPG